MTRSFMMALLGAALAGLPPAASAQLPPALANRSEIVFDLPLGAEAAPPERLVKGAPYFADALHETVQLLLDADGTPGNRIVRQHKTRLCRDGEGRARQEVERQGRKLVYLADPVAREAWVLDSERKTAHALRAWGWGTGPGFGSLHEMADSAAWRDYAERMRDWGRGLAERARSAAGRGASAPLAPPAPPAPDAAPPKEAEIVAIVRRARDEAQAAQHDAQLRVMRLQDRTAGAPAAPLLPVPPGVSWAAQAFAPRGPAAVSSLGSKEIEGLKVHCERSTWTIEAGKIGNDKQIVVVRDVWTSPELMLTVQSRDFDPRRGETNYRLVNVKRGEPDPALMQVPADYVKSGSARR